MANARPIVSDEGFSKSAKMNPPNSVRSPSIFGRSFSTWSRISVGPRELDVLVQLDVGVGDLPGRVAPLADLLRAGLAVGALDPDDALFVRDVGEDLLHPLPDRRVVDALGGLEHDRAGDARALAPEVLVEQVEAGLRLALAAELVPERVADRSGHPEADDEQDHPGDEDLPSVVVAPGAES